MQLRHESSTTTDASPEHSPAVTPSSLTETEEAATTTSSESRERLTADQETTLSRSARKYRSLQREILKHICLPFLLIAIAGALESVLGKNGQKPTWLEVVGIWPPFLWILGYVMVSLVRAATDPKTSADITFDHAQRRALMAQVTTNATIQSIGSLLDSWDLEDNAIRRTALLTLTPLLSQLTAENAPDLTSSQRRRLTWLLDPPTDLMRRDLTPPLSLRDSRMTALRIAALHAIPYVGGREALPIVRRLATEKTRTQRERQIQEAAINSLPLLERFVAELDTSETLLRASSARGTQDLLRPVEETPASAQEELLRASRPEHSTE